MSANTGAGGNGNQMVCDMDEHGTNGDMKSDALNVAGTALETYQEEKDISRHIKVCKNDIFQEYYSFVFLLSLFTSPRPLHREYILSASYLPTYPYHHV